MRENTENTENAENTDSAKDTADTAVLDANGDQVTEVIETVQADWSETQTQGSAIPASTGSPSSTPSTSTAAPRSQVPVAAGGGTVSRKMGIASFVIAIAGSAVALLALILAIIGLVGGPSRHSGGDQGPRGLNTEDSYSFEMDSNSGFGERRGEGRGGSGDRGARSTFGDSLGD